MKIRAGHRTILGPEPAAKRCILDAGVRRASGCANNVNSAGAIYGSLRHFYASLITSFGRPRTIPNLNGAKSSMNIR